MKTFSLLAPDYSALDLIRRHPLPFALWPVGHQGLVDHWVDEAVRCGAEKICVYVTDRPAEVRRHLAASGYWGRKATVQALRTDTDAPPEAIRMDRLPHQDGIRGPCAQPQELLSRWLEMHRFWLTHRQPGKVAVDEEVVPGGWVGPHVRLHPRAILRPPFWIGARAEIGAGCRVGPHAFVGEGSVLDANVEIEDAVALPATYVGRNTRLHQVIVQGGILVDVQRACRIEVAENFVLGSLAGHRPRTPAAGRLAALGLWLLLAPAAKLWPGQAWRREKIGDHQGSTLTLESGTRGPLLIRRWPWLKEIALGRFCWFGILPRRDQDWEQLPAETADRLRSNPPGVFSWADLQGCHDVSAPDEWIHAAYQALQPDGAVSHMLLRHVFQLALSRPEA